MVWGWAGTASATIWDDSGPGNWIRGLEIGGSSYDVSFGWTSYGLVSDEVKDRIVFWDNQADALIAANAVNSFLTAEEIRNVSSSGNRGTNFVAYDVVFPPADRPNVTGVYSSHDAAYPPIWEIFRNPYTTSGLITYTAWTDASAVPLPATAWLFGSALVGLVGLARRKKT